MRFSSMARLPWSERLYSMPSSNSSRSEDSWTPKPRSWNGRSLDLKKGATFTAREPSVGAVAARCARSVDAVSCTVEVSTRRTACVRHGPRAPTIALSKLSGSGEAGSSIESALMRLRNRIGVSSARAAMAAALAPPGRANASALRQSPATKSRLAGVGMLASFMRLCNSSTESAVLENTCAELSSVRMRDQPASVSLTVSTSTASAAARSAAMREILQRGKKALTA